MTLLNWIIIGIVAIMVGIRLDYLANKFDDHLKDIKKELQRLKK